MRKDNRLNRFLDTIQSSTPSAMWKNRFRDPFGNVIFLKGALTGLIGLATYRGLNIVNKTGVKGADYLMDLPETNVLFISNHQTYYIDVIALFHVFCSVKWKYENINFPFYLLMPRAKTYYIAAEETMYKNGILPYLFSYTGAVTVKRSWRSAGKDVKRGSDLRAPDKIKKALSFGWVINFPQGTTAPNAPVRKGSASLIKSFNPIVVPVVLDGFDKAYDKKGVRWKNRRVKLSITFKKPIQFGEDASVEEIHEFLKDNIV